MVTGWWVVDGGWWVVGWLTAVIDGTSAGPTPQLVATRAPATPLDPPRSTIHDPPSTIAPTIDHPPSSTQHGTCLADEVRMSARLPRPFADTPPCRIRKIADVRTGAAARIHSIHSGRPRITRRDGRACGPGAAVCGSPRYRAGLPPPPAGHAAAIG